MKRMKPIKWILEKAQEMFKWYEHNGLAHISTRLSLGLSVLPTLAAPSNTLSARILRLQQHSRRPQMQDNSLEIQHHWTVLHILQVLSRGSHIVEQVARHLHENHIRCFNCLLLIIFQYKANPSQQSIPATIPCKNSIVQSKNYGITIIQYSKSNGKIWNLSNTTSWNHKQGRSWCKE